MHVEPRTAIRHILPPTHADREARKRFVDKQLVVQEWSQRKSKNENTALVSGDVKEGTAKEERAKMHNDKKQHAKRMKPTNTSMTRTMMSAHLPDCLQ